MSAMVSEERWEKLESLLMHLQHDCEQLGQVVWRQQAELDALRRELAKLNERLDDLSEEPEVRDPLAERPPHY